MRDWFRFPIRFACSLTITAISHAAAAHAQDEAVVDAVAAILFAEDARRYDERVLTEGTRHADPIVRRHAALALGRIGDRRAVPLLLEQLADLDSLVRLDAAFAIGQLGDPLPLGRLRELLIDTPIEAHTTLHAEIVAAVAKIGDPEGGSVLRELLTRWGTTGGTGQAPVSVIRALREAWRLQDHAPHLVLARFARSSVTAIRRPAVYALARLAVPETIDALLQGATDPDADVRRVAVRSLTRAYADSADRNPSSVAGLVRQLVDDSVAAVRIAALRALATYGSPELARAAEDRVSDADPNVRLEAVSALGALGNSGSVTLLTELVRQGPGMLRRPALISLARLDAPAARRFARSWMRQASWQARATAAEVLAIDGSDSAVTWLGSLVRDADGRVAAQALAALERADSIAARSLAPAMLAHSDPVVRTFAAEMITRRPDRSDVDRLVDAYGLALGDSIPDARLAAVAGLGALARSGLPERVAVEDALFGRYPQSDDALVRRAAVRELPGSTSRWGPAEPVETGRDIGDYRDLARRFVLPVERGASPPRLIIETERGAIVVELFAADAPVTINALLRLAAQRYFDGQAFHRVVPAFVAQGGDPRGDGWGGPGFALRDEVSRRRYERGTIGMALFGPDTGGSQFFVTLAAQPHLEGIYPVLGRVLEGDEILDRLIVGDRIRSVRTP